MQWRAWIGPHFDDYDWSLRSGAEIELPDAQQACCASYADAQQACCASYADAALAAPLAADGAALRLAAAGWPAAGGAWVGPAAPGERWEYLRWSAAPDPFTLAGLQRDDRPGPHSAGAAVRRWWPVESDDGRLSLGDELSDDGAAVTWRAELSGVLAPAAALRPGHAVAVASRPHAAAPWTLLLLGFLDGVQIEDGWQGAACWRAGVVCSGHVLAGRSAPALRSAALDLLAHGRASSSRALEQPEKERASGDFAAAAPSFAAANVLDRDPATLWIAEQLVGAPNWRAENGDPTWSARTHLLVTALYLQRPPGFPSAGYRWIELTVVPVGGPGGPTSVQDQYLLTHDPARHAALDIGGPDYAAGEKIVVCENRALWEQENPVHAVKTFCELPDPALWDGLDPAGGCVALMPVHARYWEHGVAWGAAAGTSTRAWLRQSDDYGPWPGEFVFPGPRPGALPAGQALVYRFDGGAPDALPAEAGEYWQAAAEYAAGYTVGLYGGGEEGFNRGRLAPVWLQVEPPGLGLRLANAASAAAPAPGEALLLSDGCAPSALGLPESGVMQVGGEQIAYSAVDRAAGSLTVAARGANGTQAAPHAAGDPALLFEALQTCSVSKEALQTCSVSKEALQTCSALSEEGIAADALPLASIGWRAPAARAPRAFRLYATRRDRPRTPGAAGWEADWTLLAAVTEHSGPAWEIAPAGLRPRALLFVFDALGRDPARPRLAAVTGSLDPSCIRTPGCAGTDAEMIAALLAAGGLPSAALELPAAGQEIAGIATAAGAAWDVAADFADFAGLRLSVGRDSRISLAPNSLWSGGWRPTERAWNGNNTARLELMRESGEPAAALALEWRTADGTGGGVAWHPPAAQGAAAARRLGPYVLAGGETAQAAAARRFAWARTPLTCLVQPAVGELLAAGGYHRVEWPLGGEAAPRFCVAAAAYHRLAGGELSSALLLREVE